jgi:hypothetical protein
VLLSVLKLPDHERAGRIGEFYGDPRTRTFAQLLIDLGALMGTPARRSSEDRGDVRKGIC